MKLPFLQEQRLPTPFFFAENTVYLTWKDPVASVTRYETLLKVGCDAANQGTEPANEDDLVQAIWSNGFSGRDVHRVNGTQLKYWDGGAADATNSAGLIRDANGQCGAWAEFFMDTMSVQGITATQKMLVTSKYTDDPSMLMTDPRTFYRMGSFLVKDWTFNTAGTAPSDVAPFNYRFSTAPGVPTECTRGTAAPGQGNDNPPGGFYNHFIVKYNGRYYDPSYGERPFSGATDDDAHAAWEDASISGFTR